MNKKQPFTETIKVKVKEEEIDFIYANGIIKRLLEKYKPSIGLKVLHGGKEEEQGKAA